MKYIALPSSQKRLTQYMHTQFYEFTMKILNLEQNVRLKKNVTEMRITVKLHWNCVIRAIILGDWCSRVFLWKQVFGKHCAAIKFLKFTNRFQTVKYMLLLWKKEIATAAALALPIFRIQQPALSFEQSIYTGFITAVLFIYFSLKYYLNEKYLDGMKINVAG